jgi:hypothetical protein
MFNDFFRCYFDMIYAWATVLGFDSPSGGNVVDASDFPQPDYYDELDNLEVNLWERNPK